MATHLEAVAFVRDIALVQKADGYGFALFINGQETGITVHIEKLRRASWIGQAPEVDTLALAIDAGRLMLR